MELLCHECRLLLDPEPHHSVRELGDLDPLVADLVLLVDPAEGGEADLLVGELAQEHFQPFSQGHAGLALQSLWTRDVLDVGLAKIRLLHLFLFEQPESLPRHRSALGLQFQEVLPIGE